jgi:MFS family permease
VGWLLAAYALFGVGLGMVNPAITNSAVAGMPLSQAGVAAAIASTSRQVGAALGVAVSGTVVAAGHAPWYGFHHSDARNLVGDDGVRCGGTGAGVASNTAWAQASTERVAHLLEERH